jgi:RNA polymerase sigma-70 factor (ECF subfamily)
VTDSDPDVRRFEALFRAHHRAVLGYVLRRTSPPLADEAVAETFLVLWRRLGDVPDDVRPWLFGVARHCIANAHRGAARSGALADRVLERTPDHAGRDPGDIVGERDVIRTAFAALSEIDREALRLVAWEGLDTRRAARAAGCSRAAFAVRLHRARRRLGARLAALEGESKSEACIEADNLTLKEAT